MPRVPLHVAYAVGEEDLVPVYHGNEVTPTEVMLTVHFSMPSMPVLCAATVFAVASMSLVTWSL